MVVKQSGPRDLAVSDIAGPAATGGAAGSATKVEDLKVAAGVASVVLRTASAAAGRG
jgi:hypothetical protein